MALINEIDAIKAELAELERTEVKIALFGQPGAGKSSLINSIIGQGVANTGARTAVTTGAEVYVHNGVRFVDLPGYGTARFPANEWLEQFNPEQYDMFLCVFSGKFHESDTVLFRELQVKNKVCVFVRYKADEIWDQGKSITESKEDIAQDVNGQVGKTVKTFFISNRTGEGVEALYTVIEDNLNAAKRVRFIMAGDAKSKEFLMEKKAVCDDLVTKYAAVAAANALNPIPGVDAAVDVGIIAKLFSSIRDAYGLDEALLKKSAASMQLANTILKYATTEGILVLLKSVASRTVVKQFSKYIPIVGQIIAGTVGFGIVKYAGNGYLDDCHQLAEKILAENLRK